MKVFVCLISSNGRLCDEYRRRKNGLFPKSLLPSRFKEGTTFNTGVFNPHVDKNILDYLSSATRKMDAVMLLVDSLEAHLIDDLRNSFFAVVLVIPDNLTNCQNFLGQKLSRPFKNFAFLLEQMQASDTEQVAILPLRNFAGDDLRELARTCREDTSEAKFPENVNKYLTQLRTRKKPRRKSSYSTTYIVDDKEKYFDYGQERHAKLGTGTPHVIACEINGNFRFGKRIDCERHFNVSQGRGDTTSINGEFIDCHNSTRHVKATTHLNMFSNDFF